MMIFFALVAGMAFGVGLTSLCVMAQRDDGKPESECHYCPLRKVG